jgi:hypothetical protein
MRDDAGINSPKQLIEEPVLSFGEGYITAGTLNARRDGEETDRRRRDRRVRGMMSRLGFLWR